ncbi:hypothetical protein F5B21DRAFT_463044 [Xylaria acuta]|nr:hypothetical protein F5B21DRAFT_463044 [Xylaria acuta]
MHCLAGSCANALLPTTAALWLQKGCGSQSLLYRSAAGCRRTYLNESPEGRMWYDALLERLGRRDDLRHSEDSFGAFRISKDRILSLNSRSLTCNTVMIPIIDSILITRCRSPNQSRGHRSYTTRAFPLLVSTTHDTRIYTITIKFDVPSSTDPLKYRLGGATM